MQMKIDMTNHLDSVLMTVFTVGLYVFQHELHTIGVITGYMIHDGLVGICVLLSALSTGALNGYKFWLMWKERHNKNLNKNSSNE